MATYKKPCMHCGEMIEGDCRTCAKCGSRSPFGYQCPNCLKPIERGSAMCSGCSRPLMTQCPFCGGATFAGSEKCDSCGKNILIPCENKRCREPQFFENAKCTACGKAIKPKYVKKQIEIMRTGVN